MSPLGKTPASHAGYVHVSVTVWRPSCSQCSHSMDSHTLPEHCSAHVPRLIGVHHMSFDAESTWLGWCPNSPCVHASVISPECCAGARLLVRDFSTRAALAKSMRQSLTASSPPDLHMILSCRRQKPIPCQVALCHGISFTSTVLM